MKGRLRLVALVAAAAVAVGAGYVVGVLAGGSEGAGQGVAQIFGTP